MYSHASWTKTQHYWTGSKEDCRCNQSSKYAAEARWDRTQRATRCEDWLSVNPPAFRPTDSVWTSASSSQLEAIPWRPDSTAAAEIALTQATKFATGAACASRSLLLLRTEFISISRPTLALPQWLAVNKRLPAYPLPAGVDTAKEHARQLLLLLV